LSCLSFPVAIPQTVMIGEAMLVALRSDQSRCMAFETRKEDSPFHCPYCNGEVIIKKGDFREHHFAHKPPYDCQYGEGESQIHYRIKREIFLALTAHASCTKCEIERNLKVVRPDVSLYIGKTPVAIEIQKNKIDIDYIIQRTERHAKLGIYLVWILTEEKPKTFLHDGEQTAIYRIKKWEAFLHEMYFSRLYYWQKGAYVTAYHLNPFSTYVEETEWYDDNGDHRQEGGYFRETKTLKVPIPFTGPALHLAEDFMPKPRKALEFNYHQIPTSKLWVDKNPPWWRNFFMNTP